MYRYQSRHSAPNSTLYQSWCYIFFFDILFYVTLGKPLDTESLISFIHLRFIFYFLFFSHVSVYKVTKKLFYSSLAIHESYNDSYRQFQTIGLLFFSSANAHCDFSFVIVEKFSNLLIKECTFFPFCRSRVTNFKPSGPIVER